MDARKLFFHKTILLFLSLLLSLGLSACQPGVLPVDENSQSPQEAAQESFTTLSQGASLTANLQKPVIIAASSQEEAGELAQYLEDQKAIGDIQSTDFESDWVVAVFRGQAPSSAEGIDIKTIQPSSTAVNVVVEYTQPGEDVMAAAVESYPYQVISISKDAVSPAPGTPWVMVDQEGKILAQYQPQPPSEPFETLAQGSSTTARLEKPAVFVAGNPDEAAKFTQWISAEEAQHIQAVDFETNWVVAVFRGLAPSSAEGIEIASVLPESGEVRVDVLFVQPGEDIMGADVESYPYHIISIPRANVDAEPGALWVMYNAGDELAEVKTP